MMFNKISLLTSLLFFLIGTTVFANTHFEVSSSKNGEALTEAFQNLILTTVNNKQGLPNQRNEIQIEKAALPSKKEKSNEPSCKDYVVPGLVGFIMIVGFGSYWFVYRRRNK